MVHDFKGGFLSEKVSLFFQIFSDPQNAEGNHFPQTFKPNLKSLHTVILFSILRLAKKIISSDKQPALNKFLKNSPLEIQDLYYSITF